MKHNQFQLGQRWLSQAETQLGLGIITDCQERQVTVLFPAAEDSRTYARQQSPLTRIAFREGDQITISDGTKLTVTLVNELAGYLTYLAKNEQGDEFEVPEIELHSRFELSRPQERLFANQIDHPSAHRLRINTMRQLQQQQQEPFRGLLGARVDLIPHQLYIANEVANRVSPRVLLADEVGLGKTIEAGLILHQQLLTGRAQRVLILVPQALQIQWLVELKRRFNLTFSLFDEERCQALEGENPFDNDQRILCSLEWLCADSQRVQQASDSHWDLLVVDEAHHLEWHPEHPSREYLAVQLLASQSKGLLLLTATPEQLGQDSHFGRLHLLDHQRFDNYTQFQQEDQDYEQLATLAETIDSGDLTGLQGPLTDYLDSELLKQLSSGTPSEQQRHDAVNQLIDRHGTGRVLFRNTRARIQGFPKRQLVDYPLELPEAYDMAANHPTPEHDVSVDDRGKDWPEWDPRVNWLSDYCKQWSPAKILVICHHADTAMALEQQLRLRHGLRTAAFHEGMNLVARDRAAAYFADSDDGAQLLICSEIGGEGRNFQFAHHLVLFDLPTAPDVLEQRIGRLDRIGQTSDITLAVPYFEDSEQERLLQWYRDGLSVFEHNNPAAANVHRELQSQYQEADDDSEWQALIEQAQLRCQQLNAQLEQGRDRLLELASCRPLAAQKICDAIDTIDQDDNLANYLQQLFDYYGLHYEAQTDNTWIIKPTEQMLDNQFPELPEEGLTATYDRATALSREDVHLLSWEHPLVTSAMEWLLSTEEGNSSVTAISHPQLEPGQILLETYYLVEVIAPSHLQLQRYLPLTWVRQVINNKGRDVGEKITPEIIERLAQKVNMGQIKDWLKGRRKVIDQTLRLAKKQAKEQLPDISQNAIQSMIEQQTSEIKRLVALQEINPSVREDEIEALREQTLQLHQHLQQAKLKLDSIRVLITV